MARLFLRPVLLGAFLALICGDAMGDIRYRVVRGDNLSKIGRKFGVTYQDIMSANRMSKTTIYPDQVLIIPSARRSRPEPKLAQRPAAPVRTEQTVVARPPKVPSFAAAEPVEQPSQVPPRITEEDPLGLGHRPNAVASSSRSRSTVLRATPVPQQPEPKPFASAKPVSPRTPEPSVTAPESSFAWNGRSSERSDRGFRPVFPRSREVPAAAHYPPSPDVTFHLDPEKFPTPSFGEAPNPAPGNPEAKPGSYTVRPGDSVWHISRKFGVSPLKLRRVNNIMFTKLRPGMVLTIPGSRSVW